MNCIFYPSLVITLLVFMGTPAARASSTSELYDLQDKCGKRAEDLYMNEFAAGPLANQGDQEDQTGPGFFPYINHYNRQLNKCFMIVTSKAVSDDNNVFAMSIQLIDVNEHYLFGVFAVQSDNKVTGCFVEDQQCGSLEEWKKLTKPFMEQ